MSVERPALVSTCRSWRRLPLAASLLALAVSQGALAEPAARSGVYDNLTVVVSGDTVKGTFFDQRGEPEPGGGAPFSCIFLLTGTFAGDVARIVTWAPGDTRSIPGEIRFREGGAEFKLAEEPGGCAMTSGDMVGQSYPLTRGGEGHGWLDVGMVVVKRAVFHPAPGAPARRARFVVAFDPVVILERRAGWVRAQYLGGETPVTGWLRATDLASGEPPGAR